MKTRKIHKKTKAKKTCGKKFPKKRHGKTHRKKHTIRKRGGLFNIFNRPNVNTNIKSKYGELNNYFNSLNHFKETDTEETIKQKFNNESTKLIDLFNECKNNCINGENAKKNNHPIHTKNLKHPLYSSDVQKMINKTDVKDWINTCNQYINSCELFSEQSKLLYSMLSEIKTKDRFSDIFKTEIQTTYDETMQTFKKPEPPKEEPPTQKPEPPTQEHEPPTEEHEPPTEEHEPPTEEHEPPTEE
jgi:hypothetical protein